MCAERPAIVFFTITRLHRDKSDAAGQVNFTSSGPLAESTYNVASDPEARRLKEIRTAGVPWRKWGPYLSERQWGTVREDYSRDGDAWNYFAHDQARSRAYRWGEDGLAGISDDQQLLC